MRFLIFAMLIMGTAILILFSGFTLPTEIALVVLILAVSLDFYTTWRCLKKKGREGNPVIALLFRKIGVYKTFGLMAGLWICVIIFRWLPATEGVQTAVAFAYWLVPLSNLIVLSRLSKRCCARS